MDVRPIEIAYFSLQIHNWLVERSSDGPDTKADRSDRELGITGAAAAVANAVHHASGTRVRDLPITIDKLLSHPEDQSLRKME